MATVSLKDIHKSYRKTEVIHGIDLDVTDGELIVIVGPSGCGKSTLLRMIAGLESITSGQVCIDDKVVNTLEPRERDVAMVFQNYALYPHMNVFDNMAYGLKIAKLAKAEIQKRVESAAETLEITTLLKRKPRELSGGQRQRVAMGRAIVREPQVFLFDEPLSNLDAKLRIQMRLEIKRLQRSLGTTSLYVTHDQTEAMTLADRLVVMNSGVAEQIDSPMAIFEKPATDFVASFIGSPPMNLIKGKLVSNNGMPALDCGIPLGLPQSDPFLKGIANQQPLTVGIRPDAVTLIKSTSDVSSSSASWPARVAMTEPLGTDTLAHCQIGTGENEQMVAIKTATRDRIQPGDAIELVVSDEDIHYFDADTGARIG